MSAKGPGLRVVSVGRSRRGPALELEEEYLKRTGHYAKCRRESVNPSRKRRAEERRAEEAESLAKLLPRAGARVTVALDSGGRSLTSAEWHSHLQSWRRRGEVCFLIGGPDGFDPGFLERCDETLSLGRITLPHELALVVLVEQIYRALAAEAGHPYTRH